MLSARVLGIDITRDKQSNANSLVKPITSVNLAGRQSVSKRLYITP